MTIGVMVVDDSAIVRGLITKTLEQDKSIEVVASASNGKMALSELDRKKDNIDIIILDIEMPIMSGIDALPSLLEIRPDVKVIIASTLTTRNADISLKAMKLGAVDYIAKPSTSEGVDAAKKFRETIKEKIHALKKEVNSARIGVEQSSIKQSFLQNRDTQDKQEAHNVTGNKTLGHVQNAIKQSQIKKCKAIAIASSTGGPQALFHVIESLSSSIARIPVFITQHMPKTFTTLLADHISKITPLKCIEGEGGISVSPGTIYLAPGDRHMLVSGQKNIQGNQVKILLDDGPPINFCKPSADPMIESLAQIYGDELLVIVLTGMGSDSLEGCKVAVKKGATIITQDEETSVVWGMPGSVTRAGLATSCLPLNRIPTTIKHFII